MQVLFSFSSQCLVIACPGGALPPSPLSPSSCCRHSGRGPGAVPLTSVLLKSDILLCISLVFLRWWSPATSESLPCLSFPSVLSSTSCCKSRKAQRAQDRGSVARNSHPLLSILWFCGSAFRIDKIAEKEKKLSCGRKSGNEEKKESTDWCLGCPGVWGNWEHPFRGSLFLNRQLCGSACLQKDIIVFISLDKPFIFRNFGGVGGRRRRLMVAITQPQQSVVCVLIGFFSKSAQYDFEETTLWSHHARQKVKTQPAVRSGQIL